MEFSPSGNVLYVSEANNESFSNLYQYNLTLIDEDLINERRELISRVLPKSGALQLGPDLKIYMAKMEHGFLSAIHQPERLGEACEYIQNAVDLMGKTSKLGLPNLFSIDFISPYVGIEENLTLGVKVYPNPSNGAFKYSLTNNESNVRIQVYSLDGKSIQIKSHQSFGNNGQFTIDQKAGVYLLELACNEDVYRTKIVIE